MEHEIVSYPGVHRIDQCYNTTTLVLAAFGIQCSCDAPEVEGGGGGGGGGGVNKGASCLKISLEITK